MKMEADTGGMHLQAKEHTKDCWQPARARREASYFPPWSLQEEATLPAF